MHSVAAGLSALMPKSRGDRSLPLSRRMLEKLPLKQKTELVLLERSSSPAVLIGAHASLQDVFIVAQALGNGHGDKFS